MADLNKIYNEDCLEGMKRIPDRSVDMILCDLPYGKTACKWDEIIPFEPLWEQYERVIKDNGAIVLTASQPFTSALVMSNPVLFKYELIWEKDSVTNPFMAKKRIMKRHENIVVFYKKQCVFNPQMELRKEKNKRKNKRKNYPTETMGGAVIKGDNLGNEKLTYPKSVKKFNRDPDRGLHPTQKPVALFEYLVKTYTNEGETVLDNCMGSGTTAIACMNTERNFIGFELDKTYYEKSLERIKNHTTQTDIFDVLEGE